MSKYHLYTDDLKFHISNLDLSPAPGTDRKLFGISSLTPNRYKFNTMYTELLIFYPKPVPLPGLVNGTIHHPAKTSESAPRKGGKKLRRAGSKEYLMDFFPRLIY